MNEKQIRDIIDFIGDCSDREGLRDTPKRVINSWEEIYSGYKKCPKEALSKVFEDGSCKELVVLRDVEFYSMCEHHMLPFFGKISIGYLPDGKVVGVSKLARVVDIFSKRLQIQENLTSQIADSIMDILKPKGVIVVAHAKHMCMMMRGVRKNDGILTTKAYRGVFVDDRSLRDEFYSLSRGVSL